MAKDTNTLVDEPVLVVDTITGLPVDVTDDVPAVETPETPKVTKAEKGAAIYAAVTNRDVDAAVKAIVAMGKDGLNTFTLARTAARDAIDAASGDDDPDFDALRELNTFRNAVDAGVAALGSVAKVAADPTTGAVMAFIRAEINRQKLARVWSVSVMEAGNVGVGIDALEARMVAHFATHGVAIASRDDIVDVTDEDLDKVLNASRGGKRTASTGSKSDRPPADKTPFNGQPNPASGLNGFTKGKCADHIMAVVVANSGSATLQQINKAALNDPAAPKSDGAIRNAFMRGVAGLTMSGTKGAWVATLTD